MFRYIALSWSGGSIEQREIAEGWRQRLRATPGWQCAHRTEDLEVHVTGTEFGVNEVYRLCAGRGVVLGRLFRRRSEAQATDKVELGPREALRIAQSDGRALTTDFWGRYVAFLTSCNGDVRVLRDPCGALPCYQTRVQGIHIVFSWLEDLLDVLHLPTRFTVDWDAVALQMLRGQLDGHDTALLEVKQILPGELAHVGHPSQNRVLWSAADIASRAVDQEVDTAARQLRQTLEECARAWSTCYGTLLLRLSGGIDSAILLGCLSRVMPPQRIVCINYHSPGTDGDERRFARLAARRAGVELIEQRRDARFRLESVLGVARTPSPGSYLGRMGTGATDAAAATAHGARAVFSGSSGDQVFFERRCTWPAADHLRLHGPRHGFLRAALHAARLGQVSMWRSLASAIRDQSFRGRPQADVGRYVTLISTEARTRALQQLHRATPPALLATTGLPVGKYHQLEDLVSAGEYYDPYLRGAAPELVTPLRSQPLVEFCLATPTYLLTDGGRGRGLARRAFADDIPAEIAQRQSKGSSQDHVTSVLRSNAAFARELLLDGRLAREGLLDRTRTDIALSGRPTSMPTYVSEIHTCIAIESWVRRFG